MDGHSPGSALDPEDYYFEGPYLVFTAAYHLKRGSCCGSRCRHCPYGLAAADASPAADPAAPDDAPPPAG
ncbi:MAG: DUF5522 domain-containing protein [Terracidiphilus sp.]